ncbi:MAG: arsenical pump-driving ATPase [Candidatus Atribacteria bacterium]|nr:arsenical pump-driving ATPase [Candidatus Atribacteria bacterium]
MIEQTTRNLFFTGKGGVGKTSLACATAVALADRGKRVLLVSTDPASNLDAVLETELTSEPRPIAGVPKLFALNIDPEAAAHDFRERLITPYRGVLPFTVIARMEEQLSGGCTMEIAAFNEFSHLLGDTQATAQFDHVIFDTAPTGHTLRLLQLPKAWDGFLTTTTGEVSCVGPMAGLQQKREMYTATVDALANPELTTVILVSRPESSALKEAERTRKELHSLGLTHQQLVVNGMFVGEETTDPVAGALATRGQEALTLMPTSLATLPRFYVPLRPENIVGIPTLRRFIGDLKFPEHQVHIVPQNMRSDTLLLPPLASLIDHIAQEGRGVVMTVGKGGVGKTTIAAAIAVELARRGYPVQLTTTDPAAHVQASIGKSVAGLTVSRIDPEVETEAYRKEVLNTAGRELDAEGRALLEEDLRSPCTEEIAVFRAFAQTVAQGSQRFVILDTAPTGHTLLLLDTTEAYHREVTRNANRQSPEVMELLPRLRDPHFTRILIVTLAEPTPVQEAERLQNDLRRAGITPYAWIVNQSFVHTPSREPILQVRGRNELPLITKVQLLMPGRTFLVPWVAEIPVGEDRLHQLTEAGSISQNESSVV